MEKIRDPRYLELSKNKGRSVVHHCPKRQAMDFLPLSSIPSSSDTLPLSCTNGLLSCFDQDVQIVKHDEEMEEQKDMDMAQFEMRSRTRRAHTWLHKWYEKVNWNQQEVGILSRVLMVKRKEEVRLRRSKANAALQVTGIAAAIAGVAATGSLKRSMHEESNGSGGNMDDSVLSRVVASAAALVATVCAEAAESVGASKAHVVAVISSGIATRSSADIAALTSMAATSLREDSSVNPTAENGKHVSEEQKMLGRGNFEHRIVSIFYKHDNLVLKLGKKHLRGAFTTYKEYGIVDAVDGRKGGGFDASAHASHIIALCTTEGIIKVLESRVFEADVPIDFTGSDLRFKAEGCRICSSSVTHCNFGFSAILEHSFRMLSFKYAPSILSGVAMTTFPPKTCHIVIMSVPEFQLISKPPAEPATITIQYTISDWQIKGLSNVKEEVYGALDSFVAWELEFPLIVVKKTLKTLEIEREWKRIIQVVKWMFSKGQGKTMGTYYLLLNALAEDGRLEEAEELWMKIFSENLENLPRVFFMKMISLYDDQGMYEKMFEVFADMEELGIRPDATIVNKLGDVFQKLGMLDKYDKLKSKYPPPTWEYRYIKGKRVRIHAKQIHGSDVESS
ncbi:PPR repeat [Musa troglodytarum]|uniref:PPR repeat n=1 Tax=Musa troglodytarum TaxID=320322 RepID=A0A9E7KJJ0_9LILI|nr:PPR repeat [Musa troglodytarum]